MSSFDSFQVFKYLGSMMGGVEPIIKTTAFMSMDRRRQVAVLTWYKENREQLEKFEELSEDEELDLIIALLSYLGYAERRRDVISDMAIAIGSQMEWGEAE